MRDCCCLLLKNIIVIEMITFHLRNNVNYYSAKINKIFVFVTAKNPSPIILKKCHQKYLPMVLRHPVYREIGRIFAYVRTHLSISLLFTKTNVMQINGFSMNGVSRKVHTPRIDAPRGTQRRVENRIDAHIWMRRLCIYAHIECPRTVAIFSSSCS